MVEGIMCGGCGDKLLTEEHFKECQWVKCVCHHYRGHHDPEPKGCMTKVGNVPGTGEAILCDCVKFNPSVDFAGYVNSFKEQEDEGQYGHDQGY